MSKKPLTAQEFRTIYSKVPRLCVDLIIKTADGIILSLRKLPDWNNQWHLPGGTVYYKETISDALQRIAIDEVGVSIKIEKFLDFMEFDNEIEKKERGFGRSISLMFLCSPKEGVARPNEEASEVGIFDTIPENMISEQAEFLKTNGLL